jgi:hypothetical protein
MSVTDILDEEDQKRNHTHDLVLWPLKWSGYQFSGIRNWQTCRMLLSEKSNIPNQPGIYTLLIQPGIAYHPASSYLMYVGQSNSLRRRFSEYFQEKKRETGRPKILRLLNKYPDHIWFCFAQLSESELDAAEDALIAAYMPPCNDQIPARVRPGRGAFQ